ncbi:MAG: retroviral-like aspartic protease family protein [Candidatus Obscuribacterales bacterium]|nr:retroviral-like aspartic protease family protein [Candidatus Obscuribacterales bacterium]
MTGKAKRQGPTADPFAVIVITMSTILTPFVEVPAQAADSFSDGVTLFNQKKYSEAQKQFDTSLTSGRTARKLYYAALARLYQGDHFNGKRLMREIVTTFPQSAEATHATSYLSAGTSGSTTASSARTGSQTTGSASDDNPNLPDQVIIPFSKGLGGHLYVTGTVNGRSMQMLFDTGAESCAFGQNHLDAAGITEKGEFAGYAQGVGGHVKVSQMTAEIQVSNLKRKIPIIVQQKLSAPPLLGETFYEGYAYDIDNSAAIIRFTKKGTRNAGSVGFDTIDVPYTLAGRNMMVTIEVDGRPIAACFDTGAAGVVFGSVDAARCGLQIPEDARLVQSGGIGGTVPSAAFNVRTIRMGSIQKSNFPVRVLMGSLPYPLVGQTFFGDRKFVIDQEKRVIRFAR